LLVEKALKFRRRKTERPQEIVVAAADVFAEKGFAASKLTDIAARTGVTKGTLYLYYETKEALFEAVVKSFASVTVSDLRDFIENFEGSFADLVQKFPEVAIQRIGESRIPSVAKMVIGESKNFPDLARVWRSEVFSPLLAVLAERIRVAQDAGEVAPGPPEIHALSISSPIILALLAREVFGNRIIPASMLTSLAEVHGRTLVDGMLIKNRKADSKNAK
jgi:AcrR family transcriptional regulator